MKKLDYTDAWYETGEAYGTPFEERTWGQRDFTWSGCSDKPRGICVAIEYLIPTRGKNRPYKGHNWFTVFARYYGFKDIKAYWWPRTSEYDRARSDFAILMWALGNAGFQDLLDYAAGEGKYARET